MKDKWMGTHARNIVRVMVAVLCVAGMRMTAFSQQSLNVIAPEAELDFLNTVPGSTVSHAAIARNVRQSPVTIVSADLICGTVNFTYSPKVQLPVTLQPGDSLLLGVVSYTAQKNNEDFVGYLMVNHSPRLNSEDGEVRLHATSTPDASKTKPCIALSLDSNLFGPVIYGGGVVRQLNMTNNLDTSRTVRCIDFTVGDRSAFSGVGNQFPLTLAPNETRTVLITFVPQAPKADGTNTFYSDILVEPMNNGDLCAPDIRINGVAFLPTGPNDITSLSDSSKIFGMASTEWQFSRDFTLKNTSSSTVNISDVEIGGNSSISMISLPGSTLPLEIAPGETFKVRLGFTAPDQNVHYDKLRFVNDDGKDFVFNVQAIRLTPSSVQNGITRRQIPLSIRPNPSDGIVQIDLQYGYRGDITIYSTAGKIVAQAKNVSSWTWNAASGIDGHAAAGEYVVSVNCKDNDGLALTRSEKLVLLTSK